MLRRLTTLKGSPAVLVTDHLPLNRQTLGSLFDGHLRCHRLRGGAGEGRLVRLDSSDLTSGQVAQRHFRLVPVFDGPKLDSKGRPVPTVIAVAVETACDE